MPSEVLGHVCGVSLEPKVCTVLNNRPLIFFLLVPPMPVPNSTVVNTGSHVTIFYASTARASARCCWDFTSSMLCPRLLLCLHLLINIHNQSGLLVCSCLISVVVIKKKPTNKQTLAKCNIVGGTCLLGVWSVIEGRQDRNVSGSFPWKKALCWVIGLCLSSCILPIPIV